MPASPPPPAPRQHHPVIAVALAGRVRVERVAAVTGKPHLREQREDHGFKTGFEDLGHGAGWFSDGLLALCFDCLKIVQSATLVISPIDPPVGAPALHDSGGGGR